MAELAFHMRSVVGSNPTLGTNHSVVNAGSNLCSARVDDDEPG